MDSLLMNFSRQLNNVFLLALILAALAAAVILLAIFLAARHAWQHFRTKQFDALFFKIHEHWRGMVRGENSSGGLAKQLLAMRNPTIDRDPGNRRRDGQGSRRPAGFSAEKRLARPLHRPGLQRPRLGPPPRHDGARCDAGPEAIPPVAELLDDWQLDTRLAGVQALGRTGLPEAAEPILETHMVGGLKVPPGATKRRAKFGWTTLIKAEFG